MRRIFGKDKPKTTQRGIGSEDPPPNVPTPIHQMYQSANSQNSVLTNPHSPPAQPRASSEDDRWEVVSNHEPNITPSRTGSFSTLPAGAGAPTPSPRSPSPFSASGKPASIRENAVLQKRKQGGNAAQPVAALGILRSLDPHANDSTPPSAALHHHAKTRSEEGLLTNSGDHSSAYRGSDVGHGTRETYKEERKEERKDKKGGFWSRDKDKEHKAHERDKERERDRERMMQIQYEKEREKGRREDDGGGELTRMIGYLTATASEDWTLVLEVCERASVNDSNAKEAVRALRREFRYGEPSAQLSAARLWAIMLRNSTETFISQSTSRKFLDTLEDLLMSPRTSPVVRERVMDVVSAAAYASGSKKDTGFRGLWRKVKPPGKPDEGVPFDTDDAMFNPPVPTRNSQIDLPTLMFQDPTPITPESGMPFTPHQPTAPPPQQTNHKKRRKSPSRHNRIIPPDEDIRRLFQECKIGQGNASLLAQALVVGKPEDLEDLRKGGRGGVIREFHAKCVSSQELICAQIEWATAGAERSRALKDSERLEAEGPRKRTVSTESRQNPSPNGDSDTPVELTIEEKLLAALLGANAELLEALKQYADLERVGLERKVQDRSMIETRIDRRQLDEEGALIPTDTAAGSSRSREPSPTPSSKARSRPRPDSLLVHPTPMYAGANISFNGLDQGQTLAPPPAAPVGPRSPAQTSLGSRTPSPSSPNVDVAPGSDLYINGLSDDKFTNGSSYDEDYEEYHHVRTEEVSDDDHPKLSEKALGKRKVESAEHDSLDRDEAFFSSQKDDTFSLLDHERIGHDSEPDDSSDSGKWQNQALHPPVHFVYDAAAERTQKRIEQQRVEQQRLVNGVH